MTIADPNSNLVPEIHNFLIESKKTIVVLDEDPTGTRTVFDVPVLTDLSPDLIKDAIDEAPPLLFLLTNTHSLTPVEATALHQKLGEILREFQDDIVIISRSACTPDGHFPLQTDTLRDALSIPEAPTLLIPFTDSSLPSGEHPVAAHSLAEFQPDDLPEKLAQLPASSTALVKATSLGELHLLSLALLKSPRRFLIRATPTFVQALAGIVTRPSLDPWQLQDLDPNPHGGLIIIGPSPSGTAAPLNHLLKNATDLVAIKLSIPDILNATFQLPNSIASIQDALRSGQSVALFTSPDQNKDPAVSKLVIETFVALVEKITVRPSFFLVQDGTTASAIAIRALGIKQAMVLGQILPGVPVWTTGSATRHPGLAYLIAPGDLEREDLLTQAVHKATS